MSVPRIAGAPCVIAAARTAMHPIRAGVIPDRILPVWIGHTHGWFRLAFGLFAFASMSCNPLIYLTRRTPGVSVHDLRRILRQEPNRRAP